jgi:hypothetical protein
VQSRVGTQDKVITLREASMLFEQRAFGLLYPMRLLSSSM